MFKRAIAASIVLLFMALPGCRTTEPENPPELKGLPRAQAFFDQGNYQDAMIECVDLSRKAPDLPGLADLENRIMKRITEERVRVATMRAANASGQMSAEVDANKTLPDTYGLRRRVQGNGTTVRTPPTSMELAMQKKVTIHLDNVNLNDFVLAVGNSEGVNIISDNLDNSKTMTVHAENVPLQEILDYVSRNLGIAFYIGDNVIWATPRDESQPRVPLQTRLYRLRKGISGDELGETGSNKTINASLTGSNATINIVKAIERFVPKPAGADVLFDKKTHVLIVKNTRENLAKAEDIIENLDVCPPQVVIEARFITTEITDLRELGIDWVLNSALTVSKANVLNNGVAVSSPQTQIASSAPANIIGFSTFANAANGLNMKYQGLLTDPMFQATIHALETSGKSRTLSVPKVTTVNNKPAVIRIGQDYRYFEDYEPKEIGVITTTSANGTVNQTPVYDIMPSGSPTLQKLGIELNVTPSVGADMGSVNLKIDPNITQKAPETDWFTYTVPLVLPDNSVTNRTVTIPAFNVSEIETEVILQSGETVVMGGLISSTENKGVEEIPVLSSIPLIGRLFKHDTVTEDKENLLIFVTATILSDRGENLIPMSEEPKEQAKPAEKAAGN